VNVMPTDPMLVRLQGSLLRQAAASLICKTTSGSLSHYGPSDFDDLIVQTCAKYDVDPALVKGLIKAESNFDADAISPAGAKGLMQLMDATAASLGVTDSLDPVQNIEAGVRYLDAMLERYDDVQLALAAYNAGPGAVDRARAVPDIEETQIYVPRVLAYRDQFAGSSGWEA